MIDMKVALNELLADAATSSVHLIDDSGIYVLDELVELAGMARSLITTFLLAVLILIFHFPLARIGCSRIGIFSRPLQYISLVLLTKIKIVLIAFSFMISNLLAALCITSVSRIPIALLASTLTPISVCAAWIEIV